MAGTVFVNNRARTYSLFLPQGWQYWIRKIVENGGDGLPLVFVLHGGGQDPEGFARSWPFYSVWSYADPANGGRRRWDNQFAVVYGWGWSTSDGTPAAVAPDRWDAYPSATSPPPAGALADELAAIEANLESVRDALRNEPRGVWNSGFMPGIDLQDDVSYVRAVIDRVDDYLFENMGTIRKPDGRSLTQGIDPRRRFLFGYSEGGALAYRLVAEMTSGSWAAVHAMSTAIGGRRHLGLSEFRAFVHDPRDASPDYDGHTWPVSLFAHHGDDDQTFPPGDRGVQEVVRSESNYLSLIEPIPPESLQALDPTIAALVDPVNLEADEADDYANAVCTLSTAIETYRTYNRLDQVFLQERLPSVADSQVPLQAPPGELSKCWTYYKFGEVRVLDTGLQSGGGLEPGEEPRGGLGEWPGPGRPQVETRTVVLTNPAVVEYRDPTMNHTNFNSQRPENRYFTVLDVWEWFRAHPRAGPLS